MDISCWSIWCTYVVCTASVFCSEWKETWCGNFCYLFMFGWQLHIKAKCKVKLAYTAVLIMLPLPVQTFYPLARVRQPPNSKFYSLSPVSSILLSCLSPGAVQTTERDQDVRQLNYSLQWSLYLSSLYWILQAPPQCVYSCLWKIFQSSPWLSKSNKRRKSIYHRPFIDWRLGKWSYFSSFERQRAINWKAHITRCSGWPSAPIWFL